MNTPLWLQLARIGEECPQATEASFSALQRGKWERVAAYVFGMYRTPLSASGTSEMPPTVHGMKIIEGGYERPMLFDRKAFEMFNHAESVADTIDDLPMYIAAPGDMIGMGEPFKPVEQWRGRKLATDQAYCDALLDESIRDAADAAFEGRVYKGRTGGKDYYEQGEAATGASSTIAAGSGSNPGVVASPSLPSWPKSYDSPDEGEFYDPTDVEPWRDAARREIERLQSIIAALERDLVEAKRESMLWHHRYTKETEVLPERERLERDLAEEREYGVATFRNWSSAKDTIASLEERLRKATAQMNTSAGTGDASVASTEDILGSPADVPSPASVVDAPSAQRAFDAWRKWAHQSSAIASIGQEELDSRWWGDVARAIEEYEPEHDAQYMRYHRGRALAFIAGYLTARGVS